MQYKCITNGSIRSKANPGIEEFNDQKSSIDVNVVKQESLLDGNVATCEGQKHLPLDVEAVQTIFDATKTLVDKPRLECPVCGKVFLQRKRLTPHVKAHAQRALKLTEDQELIPVSSLKQEAPIATADASITPEQSPLENARQIEPEKASSIVSEKPSFPCLICDKVFSKRKRLKPHLETHTPKDDGVCVPCEYYAEKFPTRYCH